MITKTILKETYKYKCDKLNFAHVVATNMLNGYEQKENLKTMLQDCEKQYKETKEKRATLKTWKEKREIKNPKWYGVFRMLLKTQNKRILKTFVERHSINELNNKPHEMLKEEKAFKLYLNSIKEDNPTLLENVSEEKIREKFFEKVINITVK